MLPRHRVRLARRAGAVLSLAAITFAGRASAKLVKYGLGTVELVAIGPGRVVVDAKTHDVRLVDDGKSLTMTAGLASLASEIDVADKRLRSALETGRCPTAVLTVPRGAIRLPTAESGEARGTVRGTMQIHCQTRDVIFGYAAKREGAFIDARGALRLDMREFGVRVPTYLGLRGEPYVTVRASFRVRDE